MEGNAAVYLILIYSVLAVSYCQDSSFSYNLQRHYLADHDPTFTFILNEIRDRFHAARDNGDGVQNVVFSPNERQEISEYADVLRNGFMDVLQKRFDKQSVNPYLSDACQDDVQRVIDSISNASDIHRLLALQMVDADGKPPAGLFQGNWLWMGNYDECISVNYPYSHSTGHSFKGQYCVIQFPKIKLATNIPITTAVCIPSTCNNTELMYMGYVVFKSFVGAQCLDIDKKLSTGAIATVVICSILLTLMLLGTAMDIWFIYMDAVAKTQHINAPTSSEPNETTSLLTGVIYSNIEAKKFSANRSKLHFFIAFSVINNTRKLLNTSTASGQLTSVNGMRVLSMWWVILGHTYVFVEIFTDNLAKAYTLIQRWSFQPIVQGTFSVDSFFFMSGLLLTYICMKKLRDSNGKMNWVMFYFHRFWRLTPTYALFLLFWTYIFPHLLTGPLKMVFDTAYSKSVDLCKTYWWTNLLYINNFHPNMGDINDQCMGWSWYLANDMDFFIISPIILILLYRYKKVGISLIVYLIGCCIFIRAMTVYEFGILIPGNTHTKKQDNYYSKHSPLYNKPYTRMAPYLVGMLLGYFLQVSNCRLHLKKVLVLIGWICAVALGMSVVYGLYYYFKNSDTGSLAASIAYISLNRFSWSLAIAWVILMCATGYGGPVDKILSWKVWAPLGRLTYCAYIVHPAVLFFYIFNMETPLHVTDLNMIYLFSGNLIVSYAVAYVLSMAVEAPMLELEKIFFRR